MFLADAKLPDLRLLWINDAVLLSETYICVAQATLLSAVAQVSASPPQSKY